ncbi:hypothetical protein E8E11_006690 [Didymella keratinophila]|nr:hypothetical protein E8E11_006690 [Didymella keratinophila]
MAASAGVLWVSSNIVDPSKLSVEAFDDWYENDHALEVLALPGVPSAIKYKSLDPNSSNPNLITYEFPDLAYTASPEFTAVANQSPDQALIDRIYANASFDIRFYSELPTPSPPHPSPHDPEVDLKLACIALSPVSGRESEFLLWFAKDLAGGLSSVEGFVRLRRFELVQGVQRERNVVSMPDRPKYLVLAKFEGDVDGIREEVEGWIAKGGLSSAEVGWYGVKRVWAEGDVQKAGEAP